VRRLAFGAVLVAVVAAGCLPAAATEQGRAISGLWTQFMVAAAIVGGTVWVLITVAIVRYRRRSGSTDRGDNPLPRSDWAALETGWTLIPAAIVVILFALTFVTLGQVDARGPQPRVVIDVTAFRWQWRFDYEGTGVSVSGGPDQPAEMVVPVGEPVRIVLTSADVAHSFFVPQFLFKRDAIPGQTNEFDITVDAPDTYRGQCAEFCGVFHDRMLLSVRAVSRADFDAWLAGAATPSTAPAGSSAP